MKALKSFYFYFAALLIFFVAGCSTHAPNYDKKVSDMLDNIRQYAQTKFEALENSSPRQDVINEFNETVYDLVPLLWMAFGNTRLQLNFLADESSRVATASISQFEVPPDSDSFSDCAFVIRPSADMNAPIMHGDALKYMAGMTGSFSMDFYNINKEDIDLEVFFGEELENINTALAMVEKYQRKSPEEGGNRGKYTPHLEQYKSSYRIEIQEPKTTDDNELQQYLDAAYQAFTIFIDAYIASLNRLESEQDIEVINRNKDGIDVFIKNLHDNDFVVEMGEMIFGDKIDTYFLDAFWRDGVYFPTD